MAAELKDVYGVDAELIAGAGGIFDVRVNGKLVFSKHEVGRFPEHAEVLDAVQPFAPPG
ncbi:MAG: Rdx family protein [Phycisphaerales bacterium]|nr:Rdx family protein [Phycisphaerales bacterium]